MFILGTASDLATAHTPDCARRNLTALLIAAACVAVANSIFDTSFNSYLNETFRISAGARGALEFPRELPGFLVAVSTSLLFRLSISRAAVVAASCIAMGLLGLGFMSPTYTTMIFGMVLWSMGTHLNMPLEASLALTTARDGQVGARLGQLEGAKTTAIIVGAGIVWLGSDYFHLGFARLFITGALFALVAAAFLFRMRTPQMGKPGTARFVVRREYSLYYLLCMLYGARKQVFITFGPWVLIKVLGEPASTIAKLWIVSGSIGVVFRPALGRLIDRKGERFVLMADACLLMLVCLGYGFGPRLSWGMWGIRLAYACFVLDQLLIATTMARTMYMNRIALSKADITPTLSLGVTIDHAVSMTIPFVGGLLWMRAGYSAVFAVAAIIALMSLLTAYRVSPAAGQAAS